MTDVVFFKRAKEAILKHFNSHCKVGDIFENQVQTIEDFICPVWFSGGSIGSITRAIFCIETSGMDDRVFYAVEADPQEERIWVNVLKTADFFSIGLDKEDAEANLYMTIFSPSGATKKCEATGALLYKSKGKDDTKNISELKKKGVFNYDR